MIEILAAGGTEISPFDLNLKTSLWALGIFLVVVFILKKAAWGPIVEGLNAREDRIAKSLEQAAEIERRTVELAAANQKTLETAAREAQAIVAESRDAATAAAAEIEAKATEEIEAQRERFRREMRLEIEKARALLRQDVVEMTLGATAKLLGRSLEGADHMRLVEEALRDAEDVARN